MLRNPPNNKLPNKSRPMHKRPYPESQSHTMSVLQRVHSVGIVVRATRAITGQLKDSESVKLQSSVFRVHPPEHGKLPWWADLDQNHEDINKWVDHGPNLLEHFINASTD